MIKDEQIQALKAAAENIDRGEILDLWLRMVEASARGHKKVDMALLDEAITAMGTLLDMDKGYVICLLAEREADKALIAEQANRIAELEASTLTVKLPDEKFCPAEYAGSQLWKETEIWNKAVAECSAALKKSCAEQGITLVVGGEDATN